ncbi:TetR/AcrR family transcriptional regulator [Streptomyces sp. NPDC090088]|uniref:TetR/AcrR family transcriptional regulator n=1 Tax=Streptomyces sp. NPDC090088 TaxID=3365944 RepID=UPI0037FDD0BA
MARWEPNAPDRLVRAALALFVERGYDATTVAEIADRAGLTKSTFFRHFADKREVLFGGQGEMADRVADAIRDAPPGTTVVGCLAVALDAVADNFTEERRELALQRRLVIDAHSELQERELLKAARVRTAVTQALRDRGAPDATARLATEMGLLALTASYHHWAEATDGRPYPEIAHAALRDLQERATELGAERVEAGASKTEPGPGEAER